MNGSVAPLFKAEQSRTAAWPAILTLAESSAYVRLREKKLRNVLRRGEIRHRHEGRTILIARAELDAWVRAEPGVVKNFQPCEFCVRSRPPKATQGH